MSKIVQHTTFSLWSEFLTLPFVRSVVKEKEPPALEKIAANAGWKQAFMPATKLEGSCFLAPQAVAQQRGAT
jgi:hypothetical protein